jgi:hypothetical protein
MGVIASFWYIEVASLAWSHDSPYWYLDAHARWTNDRTAAKLFANHGEAKDAYAAAKKTYPKEKLRLVHVTVTRKVKGESER